MQADREKLRPGRCQAIASRRIKNQASRRRQSNWYERAEACVKKGEEDLAARPFSRR